MSKNNSLAADQFALSISSLQKSYGQFEVLRELNLNVERGSIHGLVGLNGSGKTTTLECILGLQAFNQGDIKLLGYSPKDLHQAKGKVVAIFDTPSLHPHLSVQHCLQQASLLCEEIVRTPEQVQALLGIEKYRNFKIKNLSLGNKRRASIAQALLGQPELIVLDEPFNGLDAEGVDDVLNLISHLNKEEGTTFLLSSHQLPYLEQICSHIGILHNGRIEISETTASLLKLSSNSVLVKTTNPEMALQQFATSASVTATLETSGYVCIRGNSIDSARINRELLQADIDVSELIVERASLSSLFREITNREPV